MTRSARVALGIVSLTGATDRFCQRYADWRQSIGYEDTHACPGVAGLAPSARRVRRFGRLRLAHSTAGCSQAETEERLRVRQQRSRRIQGRAPTTRKTV